MDTRLSQLRHRRDTLPEHATVKQLLQRRDALGERLVAARTVVSDTELEQAKAESDLQPVRDRLARNQRRIDDGSVSDAKALAGLVEEVEHLTRRISDLEDAELDVMQRLEDAAAARDTLAGEGRTVEQQLAEATAARDERIAEIGVETADAEADRRDIAGDLPGDLLALYERVRAGQGGVGAAALHRGRCTGCQLELNAADLRRYAAAAADEVLRCEECDRILVRTAESGL